MLRTRCRCVTVAVVLPIVTITRCWGGPPWAALAASRLALCSTKSGNLTDLEN